MKINKLISKSLIFSLLSSNLLIFSNANEISNRYQTLEGEYITIDDSIEDSLEEIEIFGNTIQDKSNLENIQSVGELYVDEDGNSILDKQGREQYKINIVSQNKNYVNYTNIFDSNQLHDVGWDLIYSDENRFICEGNGTVNKSNGFALGANVSNLKPNTTYTISGKANGKQMKFSYVYKGKNKLWDISSEISIYNNTFTTPSNVTEVCFGIYYTIPGSNRVEITDIQLEEGNEATKYEKHQYNEDTIILPTQLEKIGDAMDKLYWDDSKGRYVIEKNIKDILFNGEERWERTSIYESNGFFVFSTPVIANLKNDDSLISNNFEARVSLADAPREGVWVGITNLSRKEFCLRIKIDKLKLEDGSVNSFKKWLRENNTLVKYKLDNPEIIDCNIFSKFNIQSYNNNTYIYALSLNKINPTLKVTIDRLPQIAKNSVEEAKINPNTYNISLSRMYINMLPESLYKDQLQEQLSEIFSSDIVLDKKSVTANLDLYIKSENALIINLNTNFITFEDFSGIEDMVKENALQISVDSSLPYQLNAYLPTEIQNADKSNTMNKDILNIKENSESNYQVFANTTDKIVLKDNCSSGNNLIHNVDIKLKGGIAHEKDIYKTTIKFEVQQK